jgi:hypothetical protein
LLETYPKEERKVLNKWIAEQRLTANIGFGVWCDPNRIGALGDDKRGRGILYNNEAGTLRIRHDGSYTYVSLEDFVMALMCYVQEEEYVYENADEK